jgi:peptidyl-dipeptidase A
MTLAQLVFARWCQVMVRFERELYRDPEQDLNAVWWDLVSRYQLVNPPEGRNAPDWAAKIHVVSAPVYYHNYMLGELLASQLEHVIQHRVLDSGSRRAPINGRGEVGAWLQREVFAPGKRYRWDDMVTRATGEPLNPDYFVAQFIG